ERDPERFWFIPQTDAERTECQKRSDLYLKVGDRYLKLDEFKRFCADHPQLVRRLRDKVIDRRHDPKTHEKPEDIVYFLEDNWEIPSLFEDLPRAGEEQGRSPARDARQPTPRKNEYNRFPILPPPREQLPWPQRLYDPGELTSESALGDDFDPYVAA